MAEEKSRSPKSRPPAAAAPRRRAVRPRTTPATAEAAGDQVRRSDAPAQPATAEQVRVRAYYLSLERGESPHDPLHDWLRAEQEFSVGSAARD